MNEYRIGNSVKVSASFQRPVTNAAFDPSPVTFILEAPNNGTRYTYVYGTHDEVVRASIGEFYIWFTPDRAGKWPYRAEGEDAGRLVANEGQFKIIASLL